MTLAWEIWRQSRRSFWLVAGIILFASLVNHIIPERIRAIEAYREPLEGVNGLLMVLSLGFVFGIFNYTESDRRKDWSGFPYRLFVLPIPTWHLVALPMVLGASSIISAFWCWVKLVFTHGEISTPWWFAVVLGVFMAFYQTAIWALAGLRITRLLVLGLAGPIFVTIAILPIAAKDFSSPWVSEKVLILLLVGLALLTFGVAWFSVARQRHGGGLRRSWLRAHLEKILDALPRRRRNFATPAAAQFWFEWRRAGWILPICAGAILLLACPLSWLYRNDPQTTVRMLAEILAMPLVLALAVGMGFVRPDFWSLDGSLTAFLAIRPISTGEIIVTKMKVAALSVAITWSLVLAFICVWLAGWANNAQLNRLLFEFKMFYPHSWHLILILSVPGLMMVTWRSLVSGFWAGLAGSWKLSFLSTFAKLIALVLGLVGLAWMADHDKWSKAHPGLTITLIGWILALAVIAKLWTASIFWNKITPARVRQYLLIWSGATLCLLALAIIASPLMDVFRLEHLFVLAAFLVFPLARLGLAPTALAKNRHR